MVKARFWTALLRWQAARTDESKVQSPKSKVHSPQPTVQTQEPELTQHATGNTQHVSETYRKVTTFLERFARWRRLARQVSLSRCLEAVLSETHYADWLLTQPRGEQRHANVQRLLGLAQEFDQFQRQGLFRFLRFIEAQRLAETEPEVAAVSEENAVRLMSIHQSKGLEFPIVAAADLGKPFNLADLRAEIILDEQYGLCPQVKPPHTGKRYPSLPYWLARRRQNRELLGEELRLLYVAMTRARDLLLLSAGIPAAQFNKVWQANGEATSVAGAASGCASGSALVRRLLAARSYADWLGLWFAQTVGPVGQGVQEGHNQWLRWAIHDDLKLIAQQSETGPAEEPDEADLSAEPAVWQQLQERLSWKYSFESATRQPAKTSVSVLRRRAAMADEETTNLFQPDSEGRPLDLTQPATRNPQPATRPPRSHGADVGTAHHAFLQHVCLAHTESVAALQQEAQRLQDQRLLLPEEAARLDFEALAAFWRSDLGQQVRAQAPFVRRELAFTARFTSDELARLAGAPAEPALEAEFVVVQGVADLAVVLPGEIRAH